MFGAFILAILSFNIAFAGNDSDTVTVKEWNVVGPDGGDVRVVAVDPRDKDRLYASTLDGQIHTSADGGKTWKLLVNLNRPQLVLDQLSVDLRDSKIIYASGHRHREPGGFFKTTDGGLTWKETKDLKKESIHSMMQSSFDPNLILVGTINGVWVSNDSGDNFKRFDSATNPVNVDSLAIDPRNNTTFYAGTWWRAYKTTDGGKNWRLIKNGMIDDSDVFAVTIDSKNPDHIIASACSGIYESYNAAELWKKIQGIPSQSRRTRDILQHPSRPGTVYAATTEGFWMTTDGGKSWAITTTKALEINSIAVNPDAPDRVFIGTNNYGIMVSNDGGKNFVQTNDNFTSRFTYSITADNERPNRLYATTQNTATGGGFVFISNDGGQTWTPNKNLDAVRVSPFAILQDKVNSNTLYLGSNLGLYRSIDRGVTWIQLTAPKPVVTKRRTTKSTTKPTVTTTTTTNTLIPALSEKIKVLVHTEDGKNGILAGTDTGLYRTYDVTKGWERISIGQEPKTNIFAIYIAPQKPENIWVGTANSGVMLSQDNGKTWQQVTGVPQTVPISSINADPNKPQNIYVGTAQTLYLTRDGGKTWQRRGGNLPLGNYTSILINPNNTDEIYVSSALESDGGIYYSTDAGANWRRLDNNRNLPSKRIWALAFDPNDSNRIYAGTHSSGIYRIERDARTSSTETVTRPRITGN
ncbi:hypothetical protein BH10ACI1_BH10ACI1_31590 [soil metagenome]